MKNRIRKTVNFLAFNLLFFALYLNFIHQDKPAIPDTNPDTKQAAAFGGTVLVKDAGNASNSTTRNGSVTE